MAKIKFSVRVVDLFAGCGGLVLGFQNAGFEVVAAFDNWTAAINVYEKNFPGHDIVDFDLKKLNGSINLIKKYEPDMIIAGPPCQDFSSAGPRNEHLGRGILSITFARIVKSLKPKWFLMENVERTIKTETYKKLYEIVKKAGYGLTEKILDASYCGVPQKRRRLFLFGDLNGKDGALKPYLEARLAKKPMTPRDYFGDKLGIEHYYRHPRNYSRRAIHSIDEPSPVIRSVNRPVPKNYPGHRRDSAPLSPDIRSLTTHERSLIQTFPKNFIFQGTKTEIEQMIGNAVPVKLAEYVANGIKEYVLKPNLYPNNQQSAFWED